MAGEAAGGADQLDLEAAEQLIQLSGGDGEYGGSESRSWDSVTCRSADQAGGVKEKEVAVESRGRARRSVGRRFVAGKDGNGGGEAGEQDRRKSADSVDNKKRSSSSRAGSTEEEPAVESRRKGDGEDRRRPARFRWLADIYRETTRQLIMTRDDLRVVVGDDPPEEAAQMRRKRKRAADAGDVLRGGGRPRAVQGKQEEMSNGAALVSSISST